MKKSIIFPLALGALLSVSTVNAEELETRAAEYLSSPQERILDGTVQAINHSTLSSQVNARVISVHFDVDDNVQQGELILEFDDTELNARLRQAEAELRAAKASLDGAQSHFERMDKLYRSNTAPKSSFDEAATALDAARARVAAGEAMIDQVERQLSYTRVIAPYSGIVTERHIELGESASIGTPLMSGFSLKSLRVEVNFPQRLIATMEKHQHAEIILNQAGERIVAESITVFPYASTGSSTIPVRVRLPDNTENIYPGMLVKVAFRTGNRLKLVIPAESVVYRSEVVGVYVVEEDRIRFRHIRVGDESIDGTIEVLAGLDDGDRVALKPARAMARIHKANGSDSQ